MRRHTLATVAALILTLSLTAFAAVKPGEAAPDFQGKDSNGKTQSLAQYRGKFVVLEWANQGCPTSRSTTTAATWNACKRNGPAKASFGSA